MSDHDCRSCKYNYGNNGCPLDTNPDACDTCEGRKRNDGHCPCTMMPEIYTGDCKYWEEKD